jgi:hypothetical protein
MKKTSALRKRRVLATNFETLRVLNCEQLQQVAGGDSDVSCDTIRPT